MVSLNPAKFLRDQAEQKRLHEEAIATFKATLESRYHSKNIHTKKAERIQFTKKLIAFKIEAKVFMDLAKEAGESTKVFIRWESKSLGNHDAKTLAEVKPTSTFSTLLCIIRDLYAYDNADQIPRDVATMIVINEILFRP